METFNRPAVFPGQLFELNLQLLFLHRSCRSKYNFKLYRDKSDAGKFDDLVFAFEKNGTTIYRFLQAKYSTNPEKKKICEKMLFSGEHGPFDLVKYLQSYRIVKQNYRKIEQIKDVIICTNSFFDEKLKNDIDEIGEEDDILGVEFGGSKSKKFHIKATPVILNRIKNEWENRMKKSNSDKRKMKLSSEPAPTEEEIVDYLNHLTFVSNMPDINELGVILENAIGEDFNVITRRDIYNRAFQRMLAWNNGDDRRNFWTYKNAEDLFDEVKAGFALACNVQYNAQPPVKQFIGRIEQLENMHELLQAEKRVMICGLGGVGKTELVKKYIVKHGREYDDNILWIDAGNDEAFEDNFRGLANKIGIGTKYSNDEEIEIGMVIQKVYEWFKQSKSLFIFDNADCQQYLRYIRPSLPKKINEPYIIITSRKKLRNRNIIKLIELNVFTEAEATDFISNSLSEFSNDDQLDDSIKKLAQMLQYLPLALTQAMAYITAKNTNATETYQISEYIENFSKDIENFLKGSLEYLDYDISKYCESKYDKTVWTTWNVTVEALQRKEPYTLHVLNCMSFLLPDNIHIELLSKCLKEQEKLKKAVRLLHEHSLITVREGFYSVHRLVQLVTRERLAYDEKREVLIKVLEVVVENDEVVARSVDHFISAWTYFKEICSDLIWKYYHIPATIALILFHDDKYKEAYFFGVEALQSISLLNLNIRGNEKEQRYIRDIAPIIIFMTLRNGDYEKANEMLNILMRENRQHGFGRVGVEDHRENLPEKSSWKFDAVNLRRLISGQVSNTSTKLKANQEISLETGVLDEMAGGVESPTTGDSFDAVRRGNLKRLKELIDEGANVNAKNEKQWTLLHVAASTGNPEIVEYLLRKGADVSAMTEVFGSSALHIAVASNSVSVAKVLLDKYPYLDARDERGLTPLHYAVFNGTMEMVKLLLSRNAVIFTENEVGMTPLHLAAEMGHFEIAKLLLERDSSYRFVNCRTKDGLTALDVARQNGYQDIVELLSGIHDLASSSARDFGVNYAFSGLVAQSADGKAFDLPENQAKPSSPSQAALTRSLLDVLLEAVEKYEKKS